MTVAEERYYMKKAFENTPRHKVSTYNNGYIMTLFYTKYHFEKYCLEFKKIENYEKALADNFKNWHCHHKLEKDYSREELIKMGLYFNRNPDELIFLTNREHQALHNKYNIERGFFPAKGHHWTMPKEMLHIKSERFKNSIWVNNGIINKRVLRNNIPEGFSIGKIKGGSSCLKGRKWIIDENGKRRWI